MATEKIDNFPTLLREYRKRVGLSQDLAGAKLGITGDYVSQIETGRKTASPSLRLLLTELEKSPLHRGINDRSAIHEASSKNKSINAIQIQPRSIPVISWAQAGIATDFEQVPDDWQEKIHVDVGDPKAFAVKLRGDSMEPRFQDGDVVVVLPSTTARNGDLVIANIKGQGVAFKILNISSGNTRKMKLTSYNQVYAPMEHMVEDLHWIYPVHSVTKMIRR